MDRLACVDVTAFPLQLLLGEHPDWRPHPVVVVEDDRPQAVVLYANAPARRAGVRIGQRYATALAIDRHLRAAVVSSSQIEDGIRLLAERLRRFAPRVEPASDVPGVFWLDVDGFGRLHPSLHAWAEEVRADLQRIDLWSSVAVGFSRFGVYALAITHRGVIVSASAEDERAAVRQVRLGRLDLEPDARARLLALGVHTVGDFLRLPGGGIRMRFGAAAGLLHQLAAGQRAVPLVPLPAEEVHERTIHFDAPEAHVERLIFVIKRLLDGLVAALAHQALAIVEIALHLTLDDRTTRVEHVRPAAPTLDVAQLLTLIRLRLETLQSSWTDSGPIALRTRDPGPKTPLSISAMPRVSSRGIVTVRLVADVCSATADQRRLFADQTRRGADAANHALARLGAECGEQNVVRARLRDAHLPSARFAWEPILRVEPRATPRVVAARPLVRRIHTTPMPMSRAALSGAVRRGGPYIVSGGWWTSKERSVRREYHYVQMPRGELWWVYYDRRRHRLFLQGCVE